MPTPDKSAFLKLWPKCFLIFCSIVVLLAVVVLILTELLNVGASFWTTNVFAGGWCGLVMFVQCIAVFVASCCAAGPPAAFRAAVISIIALLACAVLISFDAVFIALPTTCVLTPSCSSNANSTSVFSYNFQLSFFTVFNNLGPFKTYTQSQTKFLAQTVQLGVGSLCFVLCIIYLVIYYVTKNKALKQVGPGGSQPKRDYPAPQPSHRQQSPDSYQAPRQNYRAPQPRAPQATPGELPWSTNKRY